MDYYLTKPLRESELAAVLKAVQDGLFAGLKSAAVDKNALLSEAALFGEDVYLDLISAFLRDYRSRLEKIKKQIKNADLISAEKEIHRLAGTLSVFYCSSLVKAVKKMEEAAATKNLDGVKTAYPIIEQQIYQFAEQLKAVRQKLQDRPDPAIWAPEPDDNQHS